MRSLFAARWAQAVAAVGACAVAVACGTKVAPAAAASDATAAADVGAVEVSDSAVEIAGPQLPARLCKPPATLPAKWFSIATAEFGLTDNHIANAIAAADIDGDGFADLFTSSVTSHRTTADVNWKDKQLRFLLMSKPSAGDAKKRVFVDALADSGLLATRDGKGNRGWGSADLGDLDNDGDTDVILCPTDQVSSGKAGPEDACDAFLNDGKGKFALAPSSDLNSKVFWVPGGVLADFDRDGNLDFWPSTVAHWPYGPSDPNTPPTLFQGHGDGTFTNASEKFGLPTKDGSLKSGTQWRRVFGNSACDLDGDGDDDMIFASYGRQECQVWINDGGTFFEAGENLGLDHDDRTDTSDDQSFRCFCAANPNHGKCKPMPPAPVVTCNNAFGPNSGPYFRGWIPGVSDQPYSLGGNYFSFACGDIDDDGDMDLLSATIVHGDVGSASDPSELILNPADGSKFVRPGNEVTGLFRPETGIYWNHGESMALMLDVNLDGRKDVMWTQTGAYGPTDTASLFTQGSDGKFTRVDKAVGLVSSEVYNFGIPAWLDIDGDGDLDLVSSANKKVGTLVQPTMLVYRNDVAQAQNLLRIRLDGGKGQGSNRSAIGAVVRVTAGGRTQTQYVSGGYGHGNVQADLVLTFGLGSACDVDSISVRWPDAKATVSEFKNVRANYAIGLTMGTADVAYGPALGQ